MEEIIKKMPTWLIAIALAAFVGMLGHSLFVSGKPFQMFGQQWGAIVEVPTPPPAVTALPASLIVASESECKTLDGGWSTYTPQLHGSSLAQEPNFIQSIMIGSCGYRPEA